MFGHCSKVLSEASCCRCRNAESLRYQEFGSACQGPASSTRSKGPECAAGVPSDIVLNGRSNQPKFSCHLNANDVGFQHLASGGLQALRVGEDRRKNGGTWMSHHRWTQIIVVKSVSSDAVHEGCLLTCPLAACSQESRLRVTAIPCGQLPHKTSRRLLRA